MTVWRCSNRTKPPDISDITNEEDGVKELVKEVNQFFVDFVDTGAARETRGREWFARISLFGIQAARATRQTHPNRVLQVVTLKKRRSPRPRGPEGGEFGKIQCGICGICRTTSKMYKRVGMLTIRSYKIYKMW